MQKTFIILIMICCFVDFATSITNESLAKSNKKTSAMMKTFVKISEELLPENSTTLDNGKPTRVEELVTEPKLEKPTPSTPTKRKIELSARQNLIMNQIIATYALSGVQDPVCRNHTLEYKKALRDFEPWALKMFDSSSKLQPGIFWGDLMDYGSFRECVEIYANTNSGPIRGQHCTLKITPNDNLLRYVMSYRNVSRRLNIAEFISYDEPWSGVLNQERVLQPFNLMRYNELAILLHLAILPAVTLVLVLNLVSFIQILVRFKKVRKLMLGAGLIWSVCVPDSCSSEEILRHFNKTILLVTEGLTLNVTMDNYSCYKITEDEPPLNQTEWIVLLMFALLLLITTICTAIDVKSRNSDASRNQLIMVFSAYSNVRKLLAVRTEKQPLDCLHGIRVLSMCYVVVGHRYVLSMFFPLINAMEIMDWVMYYTSTIIIGGTVCVDTFFMLTGLLVTYTFFEQMSKGIKFNLPLFLLHRWLRVTPALMVVALIHATLVHHLGSGPLWKKTLRPIVKSCQYFWWAAALHIQNYVNAPFICVLPTWYLTCDTWYYFLSPLILYPLWKWPVFGYLVLIITYILSVAISFYLAWINEYDGVGLLSNQFLRSDYFIYHYITPHTRAAPFLIGMGLGYVLFRTRNQKIRMSALMVTSGWMCSFSLLLVTVLGNHPFQLEERDYNRMESSLFLSCTRSAWTLGVVWIIWACKHGYGGPIDYILSFPTYQILGRLSYAVFLIHMGNQFLFNGASKAPGHFSDFSMIFMFFGDIVLNLGLAFLFALFIEAPLIKAQGLLMKKAVKKMDKVGPAVRVVEEAKKEFSLSF